MSFGGKAQRAALERLYEDRVDILRPGTVEKGAVVRTEFVLTATDLPCALSRLGKQSSRVGDKSARRDMTQEILWDAVLFLAPEMELFAGDRVRIRQLGKTMEFELMGHPARYETHQEALLREKRSA